MGRRRLLAVLLALAVWPVAGSSAQTDIGASIEDVPDEITSLLADYGRAYREHDNELMTKVVAGDLLEPELRALRNAQAIRFETFDVEVVTRYSGDLASPRVTESYDAADVKTYHITEKTQIDMETDVYEEDGAYTFARIDGRDGYSGWRIVSKTDLDPLGFFSPYHLWDEGDVAVLRSERFVLLTHPQTADAMRPVLRVAETAYDRAARFWPGTQEARYAIIVPSTTAELGRILHETVDLENFVAFVGAGVDRTNGWDPTGPRVFAHLSHLDNYGAAGQTEILAHELIHAFNREASGPQVPTWVEEGVANLGGGSGRPASLAGNGPTPSDFPTNDRFITGGVRDIQTAYAQAQVAVEVLVAERGAAELGEFYAELGSRRIVAGTDEYHVRDAIERSSGWSYAAWLAAWQKRLG